MWHVSISRHNHAGRIHCDRWGEGTWREARRVTNGVLDGVGWGETWERSINGIVHRRRSLSAEELTLLTPEWMAIPAVNHFSEEDELKARLYREIELA